MIQNIYDSYICFIYLVVFFFFYLHRIYFRTEFPVKCVDSTKENSMV